MGGGREGGGRGRGCQRWVEERGLGACLTRQSGDSYPGCRPGQVGVLVDVSRPEDGGGGLRVEMQGVGLGGWKPSMQHARGI